MSHIKDIIGYKKQVEKLNLVCDFLKNRDNYIANGVILPDCMLICGQDGVGKTFMAEALATDSGRQLFYFDCKEKEAKKLKKIFKKAKKCSQSVVIIDNIDSVGSEEDNSVYIQTARQINDCNNGKLFLIVTALKADNLPEYLTGGFDVDMVIELEPPKIDDACVIFSRLFNADKMADDFNIKDFCCVAQECTYTDAEEILNYAMRLAVYERQNKVSMRNLTKAALAFKEYELTEECKISTAYHEAGHAAVCMLLGGEAACIFLYEEGSGIFFEKDLDIKTYKDLERYYIVSIAGKACEEIYTGTSSLGSKADLENLAGKIDSNIRNLASQGFEYYDSTVLNSPAYNDAIAKKVQSDLQKYYDTAKDLIEKNKPLIEALAQALTKKSYLLHSEIYRIYNTYLSSLKSQD